MSAHELSPAAISDSTLPLETDPQVSFDIALKNQLKPGTVIDIDYDALRKNIEQLDGPTDSSNLSIVIRPKGALGNKLRGAYHPDEQHIEIMAKNQKQIQKTLQHEVRHYTDIIKNPITTAENTKNKIGQIASNLIDPFGYASGGLFLGNMALHNEYIRETLTQDAITPMDYSTVQNYMEIAQGTSSVAAIGAAAVFGAFYLAHGRERTARKAERKSLPTIITFNTPKKA
jgi:hypothetical protein